jgi:hypothetical protein
MRRARIAMDTMGYLDLMTNDRSEDRLATVSVVFFVCVCVCVCVCVIPHVLVLTLCYTEQCAVIFSSTDELM